MTDEAEKEASEVLHTLLSVERIEKRENFIVDTILSEAKKQGKLDNHHHQPCDNIDHSDEVIWVNTLINKKKRELFYKVSNTNSKKM